MLAKNPMFRDKTRARVSESLKRLYNEGIISSPFQDKAILRKALKNSAETQDDPDWQKKHRMQMYDRMKNDNPMSREDVRNKVSQTLRNKYESGEIKKTVGKDHWLWKGNTKFNKYVRSQLYQPFVRKVFERDNFTCQICGKRGGMLHAHHEKPLQDIIKEVLEKHGYSYNGFDDFVNEDEFVIMAQEVVKSHKVQYGITVCPKCHGVIDKYYKRKTHEN
jgi:5-methylcytosine-specific restriction endonuclease McrA